MSENKDNDFWKDKNDDFWKKPIMSEDWIKEEAPKKESDSHVEQNTSYVQNPYVNSHYHNDWNPENMYGDYAIDKPVRKKHVHTVICLVFIALAFTAMTGAVIGIRMVKRNAVKMASQISWQEEEVTDRFAFNDNNVVILEDKAYTLASDDSFTGFVEGQKLVAIYVEVKSDKYIEGSYILRDVYLGYEQEETAYYKRALADQSVYPYIADLHFRQEQLLNSYGAGNGMDSAGYYFFLVPKEIETVTLYMEKRNYKEVVPVIETVFYKTYEVIQEDDTIKKELAERE